MREKILHKATELFLNLGFKSVTMDDLANEMGISKKTIYSHFENKTKLVEESTLDLFWFISNGIDEIIALKKNPIKELYEIKKFAMLHLKDEKSSPQYQLQKYYPKIHETLKQKQYEVMQECVFDNVERGVDMGIYRDNLNVNFVGRIYFSGVMSIKDNDLFPKHIFSTPQLMDYYLEYHLRGIVTPKGRKILNSIINSNQE
ncbi:TetR/AcrR family transcriptional regulator [Flagellimonas hymeniacidonis]|uniref:TetR/AcrR family transcriptional regulator n=1 Tax=Flagellimonas hymeniacidonis TaxID=2603628 RepID=A0A5C8V5T1_9FLAO|nr:TetR/AcrR family transcriptional regulator [Flagellimonas hymeniacidonis]TXN37424.1 TetR/AcrR family transcriptional regulator [Flagellimonas hymeniacidonis]